MSDIHEKIFITEDAPEPPADLSRKIMHRIGQAERRALVVRAFGFGAAFAASFSFVVFGYFNLTSALAQSGFLNIVSLLFSDFGVALTNFQDFAFSIIESFPIFSAALLLSGVILTIWSAMRFVDDIALMRHLKVS